MLSVLDMLDLRKLPQIYVSWDIGWVWFMIVTITVANVSPVNHPSPLHHRKSYFKASLLGNTGR